MHLNDVKFVKKLLSSVFISWFKFRCLYAYVSIWVYSSHAFQHVRKHATEFKTAGKNAERKSPTNVGVKQKTFQQQQKI